jgi:hypothetical protein
MIMGVNDSGGPVSARKKRGKIILSWRCGEPAWCERMALEGVHRTYELRLRFDTTTRTVTMIDRVRTVDFDLCPIKVKVGRLARPRLYCSLGKRGEQGLEYFKNTPADQYRFLPREMKAPVFHAVIASGWNVRFDLF